MLTARRCIPLEGRGRSADNHSAPDMVRVVHEQQNAVVHPQSQGPYSGCHVTRTAGAVTRGAFSIQWPKALRGHETRQARSTVSEVSWRGVAQ